MADIVGYSIGRYQILEKIGEGGMATVFKAADPQRNEHVAVKIIRTDRMTRDMAAKAVHRFEREGRSLAQLNHPYIVKIFDYGRFNGYPFLVMEYLSGGTLKKRLPNKPIPWQQAARYLIPIAHALEYAHQQGIVHRDVKPSNILINAARRPILTDFGIVKYLGDETTQDLTTTGIMVGTPEYMSPEQAMGEPFDHRVDIYSLGIVFYEMVTGRKPFYADTPVAVLVKQASEPLPPPSRFAADLPDTVESILYKALEKKPQARYPTMAEFRCALEELTSNLPTVATTIPLQQKVMEGVIPPTSTPPNFSFPAETETASIDFSDTLTHSSLSEDAPISFIPSTPSVTVRDEEQQAQKESAEQALPKRPWARGLAWGLSTTILLAITFFSWRFLQNPSQVSESVTHTSQPSEMILEPVTFTSTVPPSPILLATLTPTSTQLPPTPIPVSSWIRNAANFTSSILWKTGTGGHEVGLAWPPGDSERLSFIQYKLANYEIQGQQVANETPCTSSIIEYSRTGSFLLTGGCTAEQARSFILWNRVGGTQTKIITAHKDTLVDAVLSPDETRVITCSQSENNINIWNAQSGEKSLTINSSSDVQDLDYSPDGKIFASAHPRNIAILWDALSGAQLRVLEKTSASNGSAKVASPHPGGGFYGAILVKFSPDGKKLAVGYRDGTLTLWEVSTGNEIYTIHAHEGGVFDASFSGDGQVIATGGEDAFVRIWKVADGSPLAERREHKEMVFNVAFSSDDSLLASSDINGLVIFWNVTQAERTATPTP